MTEGYIIRSAADGDRPALTGVWRESFGDGETDTNAFFDRFFLRHGCDALVAECGGTVCGGAYILRGCGIADGENLIDCPYIYGVGVAEKYRGAGIGTALSLAARDACGGPCALVPAEPALFDFYARLSFTPSFFAEERTVSPCQGQRLTRLGAREYSYMRERLLSGFPHMRFPQEYYRHFEDLGGQLYASDDGVAACEQKDGVLLIKELLAPAKDAAALTLQLGCKEGRYRCYSPTGKAFALVYGAEIPHFRGWFGLALD